MQYYFAAHLSTAPGDTGRRRSHPCSKTSRVGDESLSRWCALRNSPRTVCIADQPLCACVCVCPVQAASGHPIPAVALFVDNRTQNKKRRGKAMISMLPCCFSRNIQQLIERNIYIAWRRFILDGTAYSLSFILLLARPRGARPVGDVCLMASRRSFFKETRALRPLYSSTTTDLTCAAVKTDWTMKLNHSPQRSSQMISSSWRER
jgi:hypothetical protein